MGGQPAEQEARTAHSSPTKGLCCLAALENRPGPSSEPLGRQLPPRPRHRPLRDAAPGSNRPVLQHRHGFTRGTLEVLCTANQRAARGTPRLEDQREADHRRPSCDHDPLRPVHIKPYLLLLAERRGVSGRVRVPGGRRW